MDCLDLLPSLALSLTPPRVLGCSSFSVPPLLRSLAHKRGRNQAARAFQRRRVNVVTKAAMGRFSGAIHGNNARRGSRRTDSGRDADEDQQETNSGQDMVNNSSTEGSEHHGYCHDASDDEAYVNTQKRSNGRVLGLDMDIYDDVHGDYWPNDPYFQEMEALQGNTAVDENKTTLIKDSAQIMTMDPAQRFQNDKNGASTDQHDMACSSLDASSRRVTQSEGLGSFQMQDDQDLSGKTFRTATYNNIRVAEPSSVGIPDVSEKKKPVKSKGQKHIAVQIDRGRKDLKVRETEDAERPVDIIGYVEAVDVIKTEDRQHIRNTGFDPTDLEGWRDNKRASSTVAEHDTADFGVLSPSHLLGCKRDEQTFVSDETGLVSIDHSEIAENNISTAENTPSQDQSLLGVVEHQSVSFQSVPSTPFVKPGEMNNTLSPVVAVGQVEEPLGKVMTGPVSEMGNQSTEDIVQVEGIPTPIVEQVGQVVEQVVELIPDHIKEHIGQIVDHVEKAPMQVSQAAQVVLKVVDQVAEAIPDPVVLQVNEVADQVSQAAEQIAEQVVSRVVDPITTTASQIASILSADEDSDESDDEFEAYRSLDVPEFKGIQGLNNFTILQEDEGLLAVIYNFYIYMLKKPLPEFVLGMFAAPILLSAIFTLFYLPGFSGLALDETARQFFETSGKSAEVGPVGLQLSSQTLFEVFMFSISLSTGLQPELAPLSPYTLVVANLNALIAQLIFVFLSGAVFARLSQPSQPVRCSTVALVCPPYSTRRIRKEAGHRVLLTRFVLVGPQPCEMVDVKVDLTYKYNTVTRSGTYFRMQQSLKLMYRGVEQVRSEIAYLNHGMLVRHIIDETSPLYQRTHEMLEKEDGIFSLSVVGLERSSMQSVFHVQHYCVYDGDVIWNAEFEDMILLSKRTRRVVDHSLLSAWRPVNSRP